MERSARLYAIAAEIEKSAAKQQRHLQKPRDAQWKLHRLLKTRAGL